MFRPFKKKFQNENCDKLVDITVKFNFVEFMVGAWKSLVLFAVAHVQSSAMAVKVRSLTRGSFFAFHAATSSGLSSNCLMTLCNQFPCMCMYSNLPKLDVECSRSSYCNWEKLKSWKKIYHLQIYPHHSSCSSCSWQVEMTQRKYFQQVLLYIPQIYEQCEILCALLLWKAMLPLWPFFALKNEAKWEAPSVLLALCTVSHFVQCGLFAHFARSWNFSFTVARSQVAWTMQPTQCPAQCPPGKKDGCNWTWIPCKSLKCRFLDLFL